MCRRVADSSETRLTASRRRVAVGSITLVGGGVDEQSGFDQTLQTMTEEEIDLEGFDGRP